MNNFLNINDRISFIIENQCNGNKKKFAEKIGFAPQVISNIVSGRKSKPSYEVLVAIKSSFVDISSEWLLTGNGKMLVNPQAEKTKGSIGVVPHKSQPDIKEVIDLATQLGEQINENKHLYNENMQLRAEIERLKEKKETKMSKLPSKTYDDKDNCNQNIAAESDIKYK